jgi:hypothetical protein
MSATQRKCDASCAHADGDKCTSAQRCEPYGLTAWEPRADAPAAAIQPATGANAQQVGGGECDPHGKSAHEPGAKLDAGKLRAGLVLGGFSRALAAVAAVGTHGAAKYTADGWLHVPNGAERYTDAMWRHLLTEASGEATDKDSGLHHAAHAAWNALARLDLMLREGN